MERKLRQRKRKIRNRLDKRSLPEHLGPMLNPGNIHYDISDRNHGVLYGGIGAVQMLAARLRADRSGDLGVVAALGFPKSLVLSGKRIPRCVLVSLLGQMGEEPG